MKNQEKAGQVFRQARFAGLGISVFAALTIATAPTVARAEEGSDPNLAPEGNTLGLALDSLGQPGTADASDGGQGATTLDKNEGSSAEGGASGADGTVGEDAAADTTHDASLGGGSSTESDTAGSDAASGEGAAAGSDVTLSEGDAANPDAASGEGDPTNPDASLPEDGAANPDASNTTPGSQSITKAAATLTEAKTAAQKVGKTAASSSNTKLGSQVDTEGGKGGRWVVKNAGGKNGLQRFWVMPDGSYYKGLIDAKYAGWWAYGRPEGWVVRGRYATNNGYIYFADDDGRLMKVGWNVTGAYTKGSLQRYFIDPGTHAARVGYNAGNGKNVWAHYTTDFGYVLRGRLTVDNTKYYIANNDGKLPTQSGWHVTGAYTNGVLQRYYIENGAAKLGAFKVNGKNYFGLTNKGYVLRGYNKWLLAYANDDGVMSSNSWLVTSAFGHGAQRYWLGSNGRAIKNALTDPKLAGWRAFARPEGYVVRGKYVSGNNIYLANNDGKLEADGWLVSNKYGDGTQRYYISSKTHSAVAGYSAEGWEHYTVPKKGYVLRGVLKSGDWVILADNDGKLPAMKAAGWLSTNKYAGTTARYYLEKTTEGYFAVKTGYSTKGYAHYSDLNTGKTITNQNVYVEGKGWHYADPEGRLVKRETSKTKIIESYLKWALDIAKDNTHGYSQYTRWGPDYDCSSFVITAVRAAGLNVGSPTYTGNMRSQFTAHGWQAIKYNGDPSILVRGDVLLHDYNHTEFYLGNNKRVGAHSDENGGIVGAKTGDQTGKEISTTSGIGTWFTWVLRLI